MLRFQARSPITHPVDVYGTSPDALGALSLESIRQQMVYAGNRKVQLGLLFDVSGDPRDHQQQWVGDLCGVSGIGHAMKSGCINIQGNVGNYLGARMADGTIHVHGDVGDHCGSELQGGLIHVRGDAGHAVGAALSGSLAGQNGGALLIAGSAGNCVGQSMRRGLIAVAGNAGNCCGYLMRAGTVLVGRKSGKNIGAEMLRGTIILLQEHAQPIGGFDSAGLHAMPVANLLNRYLIDLEFPMALADRRFHVFHGDRLHGSRGELLVAADPNVPPVGRADE